MLSTVVTCNGYISKNNILLSAKEIERKYFYICFVQINRVFEIYLLQKYFITFCFRLALDKEVLEE